jgi:hypothetical protein
MRRQVFSTRGRLPKISVPPSVVPCAKPLAGSEAPQGIWKRLKTAEWTSFVTLATCDSLLAGDVWPHFVYPVLILRVDSILFLLISGHSFYILGAFRLSRLLPHGALLLSKWFAWICPICQLQPVLCMLFGKFVYTAGHFSSTCFFYLSHS